MANCMGFIDRIFLLCCFIGLINVATAQKEYVYTHDDFKIIGKYTLPDTLYCVVDSRKYGRNETCKGFYLLSDQQVRACKNKRFFRKHKDDYFHVAARNPLFLSFILKDSRCRDRALVRKNNVEKNHIGPDGDTIQKIKRLPFVRDSYRKRLRLVTPRHGLILYAPFMTDSLWKKTFENDEILDISDYLYSISSAHDAKQLCMTLWESTHTFLLIEVNKYEYYHYHIDSQCSAFFVKRRDLSKTIIFAIPLVEK
ncbi:MAG: hypothetical protein J6W84_04315 [Bacteroidales bacterium]|nr:hypothetical protein [Bacteroidales bacterium]